MKVEIIRDFTALKTEFTTLKSTVSDMEHSLTMCWGDVLALQSKVALLTKEVSALDAKCDDLESRSRRQNIRIVGVREGEAFLLTSSAVSELLRQAFDLDNAPVVDRAHCSLAPRSGLSPRPIVVRLHYYSDCVEILKRARQQQWITKSGVRFAVFPDCTAKVAKAHSAFNEVRKLLHDMEGVRYSLLFPARLWITHNGTQHLFTLLDEAKHFVFDR
ncbi:hypothetical protein NFI96_005747 [Prochilodus magdalenae]|nr:hypothetical protein NFI96_005747 [Prochilodus magdalenae]